MSDESVTHPLCFLHVPKSGGSSIRTALEAAFPGSVCPRVHDTSLFGSFAEFDQLSEQARGVMVIDDAEIEELSAWRVVIGHFRLSTLLRVAPSSAVCTVLREPRTRILSMYQFEWLNTWTREFMRPWDVFDHFQAPLETFLADPHIAANIDNVLCRLLVDDTSLIPANGFIRPEDAQELASLAATRLETLGFVGIVELGNVWQGLSSCFGVQLEPVRVNVSGDGEFGGSREALTMAVRVTDRALELLHDRAAADAIVYAEAARRAGLSAGEAGKLAENAFAKQLVRLGDLMGTSAVEIAQAAGAKAGLADEQEADAEMRSALEAERGAHAETRSALEAERAAYGETVASLRAALDSEQEANIETRRLLNVVMTSTSWRATAPLRDVSRRVKESVGHKRVVQPDAAPTMSARELGGAITGRHKLEALRQDIQSRADERHSALLEALQSAADERHSTLLEALQSRADERHSALLEALQSRADEGHSALLEALQSRADERQNALLEALRVIRDDDASARAALWALRESPEYDQAFEEEEPLVTVLLTTYDNWPLLRERSLPSVLAQTYERWEAIVVGDAAPDGARRSVESFGDRRLRFVNLPYRGPYPKRPEKRWLVYGATPYNTGIALARGRWIATLSDDDAFRPRHIELLLAHAREHRSEVPYGCFEQHSPNSAPLRRGAFPPSWYHWGTQSALIHAGLRFIMPQHVSDWIFGIGNDMSLMERMLRIGVRFSMLDEILWDYYPSQWWTNRMGRVDRERLKAYGPTSEWFCDGEMS